MPFGNSFSTQTKINDHLVHESSILFPLGRQGVNSNWPWEAQGTDRHQMDDKVESTSEGNVKCKMAPANKCKMALINLPGSSGPRRTNSLQTSRNCGSPWYAVSITQEKENIILGHTCRSGLCATQKKWLCSTWRQCGLSWRLLSCLRHHALRKMEVGWDPKEIIWKAKGFEDAAWDKMLMEWVSSVW